MRQSVKRRERNRKNLSQLKTQVKKLRAAIATGDAEAARKLLPETVGTIDKAAKKGVVHDTPPPGTRAAWRARSAPWARPSSRRLPPQASTSAATRVVAASAPLFSRRSASSSTTKALRSSGSLQRRAARAAVQLELHVRRQQPAPISARALPPRASPPPHAADAGRGEGSPAAAAPPRRRPAAPRAAPGWRPARASRPSRPAGTAGGRGRAPARRARPPPTAPASGPPPGLQLVDLAHQAPEVLAHLVHQLADGVRREPQAPRAQLLLDVSTQRPALLGLRRVHAGLRAQTLPRVAPAVGLRREQDQGRGRLGSSR